MQSDNRYGLRPRKGVFASIDSLCSLCLKINNTTIKHLIMQIDSMIII